MGGWFGNQTENKPGYPKTNRKSKHLSISRQSLTFMQYIFHLSFIQSSTHSLICSLRRQPHPFQNIKQTLQADRGVPQVTCVFCDVFSAFQCVREVLQQTVEISICTQSRCMVTWLQFFWCTFGKLLSLCQYHSWSNTSFCLTKSRFHNCIGHATTATAIH